MFNRNFFGIIMAIPLFVLLLSGCGGVFDGEGDSATSPASDRDTPMVDSSGGTDQDTAADDQEEAAEMSSSNPQYSGEWDRRVIRDGELELSTDDVGAVTRHVRTTVADAGGFIGEQETFSAEDSQNTRFLVEVPSETFDETFASLADHSSITDVIRESTSSRDVTEEFVDLQAQVRNLEATESRYVTMFDEANTIDEMLSVERELTRVRGEIERITGRLNYLEQRTSFGRISVWIYTENDAQILANETGFQETVRKAWDDSLSFLSDATTGIAAFVVFLWWFWPLAIIAAYFIQRRRTRVQRTITTGESAGS